MATDYQRLSQAAHIAVVINYALLLVVVSLGTLVWPSCGREPNVVIWGVHGLMLLPFLPAIIKQQVRAHAWLTFMLLILFLAAVPTAFACTSWLTVLEVVVITVLFIAAMLYIRWRSRELKQLAASKASD